MEQLFILLDRAAGSLGSFGLQPSLFGWVSANAWFRRTRPITHMALALMGLVSILLLCTGKGRVQLYVSQPFSSTMHSFHTMYIVEPRFSVPIMPLMLVCAAVCPTLVVNALKEKLEGIRVLGNVCLAAIAVGLVTGVVVHQILQRPNYIQGGSFETAQAEEDWTFVESDW